MFKYIATALTVFFLFFCIMTLAQADGPVYSGSKTVNCTDATERSDGTSLAPDEIDRVELYVRTTPTGSPEHTVIMEGGCRAMTLDLTLLAEGQKYLDGATVDTAGRVSVLSVPQSPFVYQKVGPNPPSGIVIN